MQRATFLAGAIFAFLCLFVAPVSAACRDDVVHLRGEWGQVRFSVELADTPASRAQGLMNRPSMPRMAGMLFIYERPDRAVFWMENTLIPLDMLFLDETATVRHIHNEARPLDRTPIDGGEDVLFVLEINGGLARQLGITPGSELRHPRVDPELAAWPCPDD
ncbi:DUF192 domain-containing protein [Pararhodobacter sp. SW119]|uniref:DUF192 domain-containing protein n=1 Tax=Pararhodobacter sp. SW119 TaxID=2780075 RepID=UPI001AE02A5B|nr:DUF192 domain-containing protein [Pararhodobacter sp. SW119]